jgi:hypothetical protein
MRFEKSSAGIAAAEPPHFRRTAGGQPSDDRIF